jgi:hypothetical protein
MTTVHVEENHAKNDFPSFFFSGLFLSIIFLSPNFPLYSVFCSFGVSNTYLSLSNTHKHKIIQLESTENF